MVRKKFDDIKICFSPQDAQMKQVEDWLPIEYGETQKGFYCKWKNIDSSQLAVLSFGDTATGFLAWSHIGKKIISIDYFEIVPSCRRKDMERFSLRKLSFF